jgi:hypothetical protein
MIQMRFERRGKVNTHQVIIIMLIILLTLLSGLADAQGFIHASTTWVNGKLIWAEGLKSLLAFGIGAICYLLGANFLKQAGIVLPEIQTIIWFVVTIIGVAVISGRFLHWHLLDQLVGIAVLCGIAWLLVRTGG